MFSALALHDSLWKLTWFSFEARRATGLSFRVYLNLYWDFAIRSCELHDFVRFSVKQVLSWYFGFLDMREQSDFVFVENYGFRGPVSHLTRVRNNTLCKSKH